MSIVKYKNFSLSFKDDKNEIKAVNCINFELKKGEILGIAGSSGSGKSVIAMSLMGLVNRENIKTQSGEILYEKLDVTKLSEKQIKHIRGKEIGAIYQDPLTSLNPVYTVGMQITEGIHIHGKVSKKEAKERAIKMLDRVGINNADKVFDAYPNELSGGQRQRAIIAMALLLKPNVLIADEPTTALDVTVQAQILKLLKEIRDEFSMSIMIVTHDLGVIAEICDRVIIMNEGEIVEEGNVFDIFDNPKSEYTKLLLNSIPSNNTEKDISEIDEVILKVEGLTKSFPNKKGLFGKAKSNIIAVDNISFELKKGETLAIVGESGCGKSTLAKSIIGLHKKESGRIKVIETNIDNMSVLERSRFMQMVFQDPYSSLDPSMKIRDILSEGILYHNLITKDKIDSELKKLLDMCAVNGEVLDRYAREFSGGQRQRIALARAISLSPNIIIADEAVSALDASIKIQIIKLMLKIQEETGMSYIFISHDLGIVNYIATRVAVMYLGSFMEIGDNNKIYNNPLHPYTKALLQSVPINHPKFRNDKKVLDGDPQSIVYTGMGCKFSSRCPYKKELCDSKNPVFKQVGENHFVACHLID